MPTFLWIWFDHLDPFLSGHYPLGLVAATAQQILAYLGCLGWLHQLGLVMVLHKGEWLRQQRVRIQVSKKGISSGIGKSQEWASRASRKKAITERAWKRQVWITLNRSAVSSNRFIEREPPETFRFVTEGRRERSAKWLSGGTEGSSRKYHHCFALSRKDLSNKPAA